MKELAEEGGFQLQKGAGLINSKYKVLGRVGSGSSSSVHAVSVLKGQKQIVRAVKVVGVCLDRRRSV
jgi:hypothetical protein